MEKTFTKENFNENQEYFRGGLIRRSYGSISYRLF